MNFETKINTKELFSFLLKHNYAGFTGKSGLIISAAALFLFVRGIPTWEGNEMQMVLLAALALLFTVINPILLYTKAKKQILTNQAYKKGVKYQLNDTGIHVTIGEQEGEVPWNNIIRIEETKEVYILYTTRVNAFLWSKRELGSKQQEAISYVLNHVDAKMVRIPKKMRGSL